MAHGALLTTFPGDTTMATVDQVRALAKGGSARISDRRLSLSGCAQPVYSKPNGKPEAEKQ